VTVLGVFVVSRVMIYNLQYPAELYDMSQVQEMDTIIQNM